MLMTISNSWGTALAIATSVLLSCGQILFKRTAVELAGQELVLKDIISVFLRPVFLAALGLYAVATVLWILALAALPLSKAYPYMALSFVIVPVAGVVVFGETMGSTRIAGILLTVIGIVLVARS